MKKAKISILVFSIAAFAACSSVEHDLKSFMKCGIAASHLQKSQATENISSKLEQYIKKNNLDGSARDAMLLMQEVRDELDLDAKSFEGKMYTLAKVYNSSECRAMHEQKKIEMPLKYYLVYIFI